MIAMIMYGKAPTLISGVQKSAPSFAITRSQESASPARRPRTWPLAAHSDGLPSRGISRKNSRKRSVPKCLCDRRRVGSRSRRGRRRRRRPSRPRSSTTRAGLVVVAGPPIASTSCAQHLAREPVALLGVVQGDGRDPVARPRRGQLLGHGGHRSTKYEVILYAARTPTLSRARKHRATADKERSSGQQHRHQARARRRAASTCCSPTSTRTCASRWRPGSRRSSGPTATSGRRPPGPTRRCAAPASSATSASASRRSTAARAATTTTRWSAPSA